MMEIQQMAMAVVQLVPSKQCMSVLEAVPRTQILVPNVRWVSLRMLLTAYVKSIVEMGSDILQKNEMMVIQLEEMVVARLEQ